jgi:crotonobetainyl-CoA:carnitine CoA-transferase CaiB-like acyl-CoA transferase
LIGVLSAVILRNQTGLGQHIDIAMIDATIATDDKMHYDLEASGDTGPMRNEIYTLAFSSVLISTDFRLLFKLLIDHGHLTDPSPKDASLEDKIRLRRDAVYQLLQAQTTEADFDTLMRSINVAWGTVRNPSSIRQQATVIHRGSIVDIDDRAGGVRPITQSPYRFSNAKSGVRGPAPHRGEHNDEVLRQWLALPEEKITALAAQGVVLSDANDRAKNP